MRGLGRIYKRKGSRFWWISVYVAGKERRESSRSERKDDAKRLLQQRIEEYRLIPGAPPPRMSVEQGYEEYFDDASRRGVRAVQNLRRRARDVIEQIGHFRLRDVTPMTIREVQKTLASSYGPATVNMAIRGLGTMLGHAARCGLIPQRPPLPRPLREPPPRSGYLEHPDFLAIRGELEEPIRSIFEFAYFTGWRRSEILKLEWDYVRFDERAIVLPSHLSKNRLERGFPIRGEVERILCAQAELRRLDCRYVFHRRGRRVWETQLNATFREACERVGRRGFFFHDIRRTTVRNLVRAGVPERVAMQITGHRSRAVFERYNITSGGDLRRATESLERYIQEQDDEESRKVVNFPEKKS